MAEQVIIDKSKLTTMGDKIRSKTGGTTNLTVDQMINVVDSKLVVPNGTATADKVLSGYTFHSGDSTSLKTGSMQTVTQATPTVSIDSATGLVTASATQSAGYVSGGTKSGTLQLSVYTATNNKITPAKSATTIPAGSYIATDLTISGDSDLVAKNIKKGVKIFSVTGTYETPIDLDDITTMSWQQLSELSSKGVDLSGCLGQTKSITVSGSTIDARLVSMKYNGTKGYIFMTSQVLPTQYKMQTNTTTKTSGGWANTTFKTTLEGTIFNSINSDLRSYMKSITIPYSSGSGNHSDDTISTLSTNIFIPSVKELKGANGSYTSKAEGTQFDYFANGGSFAVDNNFFTRTRTTINQFAYFPANSETVGQIWFNTSAYVLFCFVI